MKKYLFFFKATLIFLLISHCSYSQMFEWKADIETVDSSGFYNIFLVSQITSKLNNNFSDIRIFNIDNQEIPYIIQSDKNFILSGEKNKLSIIENKHKKIKGYTSLLIHNSGKDNISNIALIINNIPGEKWIKINASDDKKQWYVLKENSLYLTNFNDSETSEIQLFNFPESKYEFYELVIYDYNNQPIEVLSAWQYNVNYTSNAYTILAEPKIVQDDTSKTDKSIIYIEFEEAQYIDKLEFEFDGPFFYLRKAEIEREDTLGEKKMKLEMFDQMDEGFYFHSHKENVLYFSGYYAKKLKLIIENKDNEPLILVKVNAYQINSYITAWLQEGIKYNLRFGNENADVPLYDLSYFKDSIPDSIQIVRVTNIENTTVSSETKKILDINPIYLWIVVGIVIALLAFIAFKMFREQSVFKNHSDVR